MKQICKIYAKIYKKYARNMPVHKYVEICIVYAEKMHKYARNMYLICKEYARNMHTYAQICTNMSKYA